MKMTYLLSFRDFFLHLEKNNIHSVEMSALHATAIANKSDHYVDLFDSDDSIYIKDFFEKNKLFLKKPLLNLSDMKQFREHFQLNELSDQDEHKSFEQLYIPLGIEFRKKVDITFAVIEGQHRSYSSLISMLTARYNFDSPQSTPLEPNSLTNNDFKYFLKNHRHENENCYVQTILHNKSELPVLSQTLNVFIRCCTKPITTREQCRRIMESLEKISKSYHDEKTSSSFKSASCTIATTFSQLYTMLSEKDSLKDGEEYNPHAQIACPRWELEETNISNIFYLESYQKFVEQPSFTLARQLIKDLTENNIDQASKKSPKLPYFLSCKNMVQLEGLSPKMTTKSKCHYDAAELNTLITAPLFHKDIYEAMYGKKYDMFGSTNLQHFLEHQNRTVYPKELSSKSESSSSWGTERPEKYYQHMQDIQAVRFCCLLFNFAMSVANEEDMTIFDEIIQSLDRAEQHQSKSARTSFNLYGMFLQSIFSYVVHKIVNFAKLCFLFYFNNR